MNNVSIALNRNFIILEFSTIISNERFSYVSQELKNTCTY